MKCCFIMNVTNMIMLMYKCWDTTTIRNKCAFHFSGWLNVSIRCNKINPGQNATVTCLAEGLPQPVQSDIKLTVSRDDMKATSVNATLVSFNVNNTVVHSVYLVTEIRDSYIFKCKVETDVYSQVRRMHAQVYSKHELCYFINIGHDRLLKSGSRLAKVASLLSKCKCYAHKHSSLIFLLHVPASSLT